MAFLSDDSDLIGGAGITVAMGAIALLGLVISINFFIEAARMKLVSRNEARWERERLIRHPF